MVRTRSLILILTLLFGLYGCGGKGGTPSGPVDDGAAAGSSGSTGSKDASTGGRTGGFVGRKAQGGGNFLNLGSFPFDLVLSGGPGRDGIPALTDPVFADAAAVGDLLYLSDGDLVMGVVINGEAKAYPHNIGWWHEIVNDRVGGHPIVVSFCPLTSTGMVFDGRGQDGSRITTGVSGLLFNNNLIMHDRRDNETLYPQMISKGIVGRRAGEELKLLPVMETTWGYWKRLYPNTRVISGHTGVYPINQYTAYPYNAIDGTNYQFVDDFILFPLTPSLSSNEASQFFGAKRMTLVLLCQLMDRLVSFWQTGGYQWTSKHRQTLCPS